MWMALIDGDVGETFSLLRCSVVRGEKAVAAPQKKAFQYNGIKGGRENPWNEEKAP